jgi:excisionase family DNA binding protein
VSEALRLKAILTVGEACELLSLSERTVRSRVADGTLETVDLGDRCAVRIKNPLLKGAPKAEVA